MQGGSDAIGRAPLAPPRARGSAIAAGSVGRRMGGRRPRGRGRAGSRARPAALVHRARQGRPRGGDRHHWGAARVDGLDDLGVVDALTPSRAISTACAWRSWWGAKRRRTPALAAARRSSARAPVVVHGRPRVRPLMTQNSGPIGSATRAISHGSSSCQPQSSIPISRRRPPLPRRTRIEPRRRSRSASRSASASSMRRPARHNTTISPRSRRPCRPSPAMRITATISSTVGGSAG
jgi:hypothetical protein